MDNEVANMIEFVSRISDKYSMKEWTEFTGSDRLGELSFEKDREIIERSLMLIKYLGKIDLAIVPKKFIMDIGNAVMEVDGALEPMFNVSPARIGSDIRSELQRMRDKLNGASERLYNYSLPTIAMQLAIRTDPSELERRMISVLDDASAKIHRINTLEREAKNALESVRQAAGQTSIEAYAVEYGKLSVLYSSEASKWLASAIFAAIGVIGFGVLLATGKIGPVGGKFDWNFISSKAIILIGLYYWLSASLKSFRAAKHNQVLYSHKMHALKTYRAFSVALESDQAAKSAVLTQAASSIFSAHSTGYVATTGDNDGDSRIFEIVKSFTQKDN